MPWLKRGINRFLPSVIYQPNPQIPITLQQIPTDSVILDIGAGGRIIAPYVLGVDFIPFPNTSILGDIHRLPFADNHVSCIFCTGVLEHVEEPNRAMREMYRVLQLGGILHLEVPFIQPYHPDPVDYWRWTLNGLCLFAQQHGFIEIRSGTHLGSTSAMNSIAIAYWQSWSQNRYFRKFIDICLSYVLMPFKYIDKVIPSNTKDMPSGVYIVCKKGERNQL